MCWANELTHRFINNVMTSIDSISLLTANIDYSKECMTENPVLSKECVSFCCVASAFVSYVIMPLGHHL